MSLYSAMRAGVSGLGANSAALAVISDNIANVNTTAYKRGSADFNALINAQAQSTAYSAGGVVSSSRRLVSLQGSLEQTRSPLDLALSGAGFFIVTEDPDTLGATGGVFTRAGSFALDRNGLLVNNQGYFLLGSPIQNGATTEPSSIAALQPVDLSGVGSRAIASTRLGISANLDVRSPETAFAAGTESLSGRAGTTRVPPHLERTVEIYDSLGRVNTVTVAFLKTSDSNNEWQVEAYWRDEAGAVAWFEEGQIAFGTGGTIENPAVPAVANPFPTTWTFNWTNAAAPTPVLDRGADLQTIAVDLSSLTQYAAASTLDAATVDGSPPGDLVSATVSRDGTLSAQFSNGRTEALYQIPIATFLNPDGLLAERGGAYRQTIESGLLTINTAGSGGAGAVQSNALEGSNVDLGSEFTTMITTQRAYSASSRIITTANEMLEELLQVVR